MTLAQVATEAFVLPKVQLPKKVLSLFRKRRYKVRYGGRGSAKSWSVARILVMLALDPSPLFPGRKNVRILCARELQNSITESVHKLLCDQIELLGLGKYFIITNTSIESTNGSEFIFSGIKTNITKIKSMEGVDIVWVEEAEKVSDNSWQVLIPTIRKEGSEIWVTFNPDDETDPTSQRFIENPPPDADIEKMNWEDNPWFPQTELVKEKDYLYRVDPEAAEHVWGGGYRKASQAQIFKGKYTVEAFTPVDSDDDEHTIWRGPYYGADFGFADDPTVLLKLWIYQRRLYIEYESYHYGLDLEYIGPTWLREVPGCADHIIRADSARPETISYIKRNAHFNIVAVKKWDGSVEDGVKYLRAFESIVIHPRCKNMQQEAKLYKYKTDKLTGDVLPVIIDKHNHGWDSARYGLQPLIQGKRSMTEVL